MSDHANTLSFEPINTKLTSSCGSDAMDTDMLSIETGIRDPYRRDIDMPTFDGLKQHNVTSSASDTDKGIGLLKNNLIGMRPGKLGI